MRSFWHNDLRANNFHYFESSSCSCNNYYRRTHLNGTITIRKQNYKEDALNCTESGKPRASCLVIWQIWRSGDLIAQKFDKDFKSWNEVKIWLSGSGIDL